MKVGLLTLRLHLPNTASLKEKRSIVKGILADVERRGTAFAAAEVGDLDAIDRAMIRVAHVSNDLRHTDSALAQLLRGLEFGRDYTVETSEEEIL